IIHSIMGIVSAHDHHILFQAVSSFSCSRCCLASACVSPDFPEFSESSNSLYPLRSIALAKSWVVILPVYVTCAVSVARFTDTSLTPSSCCRNLSTELTQLAQCMPSILRVHVCASSSMTE